MSLDIHASHSAVSAALKMNILALQEFIPTNSFAAVKNTWLHTITPRTTKKKEYPHHTYSSKTVCFHTLPNHTRLPGEGNTSQTLALIMLTSCLHAGFQQMEGGGVEVTPEGPEKRRYKGRHAGD